MTQNACKKKQPMNTEGSMQKDGMEIGKGICRKVGKKARLLQDHVENCSNEERRENTKSTKEIWKKV